jgi:hypothetical protein
LLQVQGFGQRYEDASGNSWDDRDQREPDPATSRSRSEGASAGPRLAGRSRSLHGQDGFSGDKARGFAPTPLDFQFGLCTTASSDAHCTADPNAVPKAIDVLTPPGTAQADELDYTLHNPVVLQGVTVP